ncbi:PepSY domain-containing protein [Undibacterium sp. RTI2.1]|uniref:PepSY-associated TM helix domain-containing protein n=2 Tax=Pseudomonadota TaxID=1224 RepID=UPI002AB4173F|nr:MULTISPECIES: PepSY domain-containing protein [unclassified Undibacterium]MDY7536740.1 PepSY domain-containing protein [Undibacterium sp. 5I1]MEB0032249.1 PepSY domain-containing protein [Undibacterium sp. RTI2.1]MEB0115781.1 PepSY domain-containing protein [Undibacterium sp. RTI2.2]MEB0231894.1 PepSY domain-containing protein [Undibacterium sp. 10I3]MEB0256622.1 PepSY domain-containing protein [Undibacterium sp. 5I1]
MSTHLSTNEASSGNTAAMLYRIFWRLHFWSGLMTAPILLFAAVSGILYIFTPQIEAWKYQDLDQVDRIMSRLPLDQQLAAAQSALPGKTVKTIIPAYLEGETTKIVFGEARQEREQLLPKASIAAVPAGTNTSEHSDHIEHKHPAPVDKISKESKTDHSEHNTNQPAAAETIVAYVDPGTARVQGALAESDRFRNWSRKLHSNMLQGDGWRWLIELGASWMLLMMITGIYLWWPRGKASWRSVLQWTGNNTALNTRANWRYLHSIVSVALGLVTLTILLTGITWSKYAGENFRMIQNLTSQNSPRAPKNLISIVPVDGAAALSLQAIYTKAKQLAPDIQMQLTPPKASGGIWRVENYDRSQPAKRFQLVLDAYAGNALYQSDWASLPTLARATAVGIAFHRGEFGWWNQALLVLVGLSVMFSVISGYVMWLQRRKARSISAPKIQSYHIRAVPWWMWVSLLGLGIFLPTLGMSLLIILSLEAGALLWQRQPVM